MCLSLEIGASDEEGWSLMKCLSLEIGALLEPEGLSLMMCLSLESACDEGAQAS